MADANPVWQSHHSRGSHGKAVTDQKRLSFALEFVVSTFPRRRRGGIGRRAGLKIQGYARRGMFCCRFVANGNNGPARFCGRLYSVDALSMTQHAPALIDESCTLH